MNTQIVNNPVTPEYITIGAHYRCNASCRFCLGGDYPDFSLDIYRDFFEEKLLSVMRRAQHVGFCGYGEVLLMPGIERFLDYVNYLSLPDVTKVFTTNGLPLTSGIIEKLTEGRYSLVISLHASSSGLHKFLIGRDGFDRIISNIRELIMLKNKKRSSLHLNLAFLMTNYNISDLPRFVRLAAELGAEAVSCSYLTVYSAEQLNMSCFFQKEKTNRMLDEAVEIASSSGINLSLPPRFGVGEGQFEVCEDPWKFFYVEVQGSVNPCCFAGEHIGYLDRMNFFDIWNGRGYRLLREGFDNNKPYKWCRHCYRCNKSAVDDIRSHITARPEARAYILKFIEENGIENIMKQAAEFD